MSIGEAKQLGGSKFKEQWGPSVLAALLAFAACIVAACAILGVGGLIISGPAIVGLLYVYYKNINGEKIEYLDMLHPIKTNFGEVVLGYLLKLLFVVGPFILVGSAAASFAGAIFIIRLVGVLLIVVLAIAACVAFIIISLHLELVEYILMREDDAKGWEAIKRSKRYMNGNKGRMFGFELSFIGWWILVGIFFPLALYVVPYYLTSKMYFLGSLYEAGVAADNAPAPQVVPVEPYVAPASQAEQPYGAAEQPYVTPAPERMAGATKFCSNCGVELPAEAAFCNKCGAPQ